MSIIINYFYFFNSPFLESKNKLADIYNFKLDIQNTI